MAAEAAVHLKMRSQGGHEGQNRWIDAALHVRVDVLTKPKVVVTPNTKRPGTAKRTEALVVLR
jgi:hypothetical protein